MSVHLETGRRAESDTHDGPQNILLPASMWAMEKWLQGRQEPLQLLQQPQDNKPVMKLNASSWLAGKWGRLNAWHQPSASCAMLPKHVLFQALSHRSMLLSQLRGLRRIVAGSPRHLLTVAGVSDMVETLARESVLIESAKGLGRKVTQWAHLGPGIPSWPDQIGRQGLQKSGPEPQPLLDSQWFCFTNAEAPVGHNLAWRKPLLCTTPHGHCSLLWASKAPLAQKLQMAMDKQQDLNLWYGQKRLTDLSLMIQVEGFLMKN